MLTAWKRERSIRRALRGISRQRVVVAVPGAPLVIENVDHFEDMAEALLTCRLRGWVEVLYENMPQRALHADDVAAFTKESQIRFSGATTIYRLTEAGWATLNRTHAWLLATFIIARLALAAAVAGVWLQSQQSTPTTADHQRK